MIPALIALCSLLFVLLLIVLVVGTRVIEQRNELWAEVRRLRKSNESAYRISSAWLAHAKMAKAADGFNEICKTLLAGMRIT